MPQTYEEQVAAVWRELDDRFGSQNLPTTRWYSSSTSDMNVYAEDHPTSLMSSVAVLHNKIIGEPMNGDYLLRFHPTRLSYVDKTGFYDGKTWRMFYETDTECPRTACAVDRIVGEDREQILHLLYWRKDDEPVPSRKVTSNAFTFTQTYNPAPVYQNYPQQFNIPPPGPGTQVPQPGLPATSPRPTRINAQPDWTEMVRVNDYPLYRSPRRTRGVR